MALQMVEDGGSFVVEDTPSPRAAEAQDNKAEDTSDATGSPVNSGDTTSTIAEGTSRTEIPPHDFVPSVDMGNGLEFSILVVSSVLLGAVVGFIGAILSLDGPPEKATNKSKLAATALMFALFFPSVITVFRENAVSQAKLTTSEEVRDLEKEVGEKAEKAANLEQTIQDVVTKNDSNIPADLEQSFIDADKSLAINATSIERADAAVDRIFERGETSSDDVKQHVIEVLEDIQENPDVQETVRNSAEARGNELNGDIPSVEDTSVQVQD